jgi:hypothetical protein
MRLDEDRPTPPVEATEAMTDAARDYWLRKHRERLSVEDAFGLWQVMYLAAPRRTRKRRTAS